MPPAQDRRFRQLANEHDAVAANALPDGTLCLVARDDKGAVAAVELLDLDGHQLAAGEAVRRLVAARANAQRLEEMATSGLIAHVALMRARGEDLNLTELARTTGVPRSTLYHRLQSEPVADQP